SVDRRGSVGQAGLRGGVFRGSDPDAQPGPSLLVRFGSVRFGLARGRARGPRAGCGHFQNASPYSRLPMARVTVEDCLEKVPNRFALTVLASRRARALSEGKGTALVRSNNKVGVVALREIAKDKVRYGEVVEDTIKAFIEEQRA